MKVFLEFEWLFGWDTPRRYSVAFPPHTSNMCLSWLLQNLSLRPEVPHFHPESQRRYHTKRRSPLTLTSCNISWKLLPSGPPLQATNLESMCMNHTLPSINPGSCVCSCHVYKHLKCRHIRAISTKYWILLTSLVSTDGKIWTHIWTKTSCDRHSINASLFSTDAFLNLILGTVLALDKKKIKLKHW